MTQQDFRALGASEAVSAALEARAIRHPFQIQALVVPEALAGGDVLAKSPTGSGKTLAFAIPIVQRVSLDAPKPGALVLVPTRELCAQVTEEIEMIAPEGLRVASVYGVYGMSFASGPCRLPRIASALAATLRNRSRCPGVARFQ